MDPRRPTGSGDDEIPGLSDADIADIEADEIATAAKAYTVGGDGLSDVDAIDAEIAEAEIAPAR